MYSLDGFWDTVKLLDPVTAWRYYTGSPTETPEEYRERAAAEGLVASKEEQDRLQRAVEEQSRLAKEAEQRRVAREKALLLLAEKSESSIFKTKIITVLVGISIVAVVWGLVFKFKGANK